MWAHGGTSAATAGRDNGKAAGTSRLKLLMMMMSCSYYYHCYYYYPFFFFFYQQSVTRIKQVWCFVDVDTNVSVGIRTIINIIKNIGADH